LKNALDHVYKEWNNKPVAFISYGAAAGGSRAVEQLRLVAIELQMAPIREAILMPMFWESFDERGNMTNERYVKTFETLLAQLLWWGNTLKQGREGMEAIVQHSAKKR
jgi:NAD(P)H-dependent FMN reductase